MNLSHACLQVVQGQIANGILEAVYVHRESSARAKDERQTASRIVFREGAPASASFLATVSGGSRHVRAGPPSARIFSISAREKGRGRHTRIHALRCRTGLPTVISVLECRTPKSRSDRPSRRITFVSPTYHSTPAPLIEAFSSPSLNRIIDSVSARVPPAIDNQALGRLLAPLPAPLHRCSCIYCAIPCYSYALTCSRASSLRLPRHLPLVN